MSIVIWLLTALLVMDCLFLMLLVLIQLPKKEAGMGQAFGGGTTDALFGAGSGNVLTKLTKYSTAVFFISTLVISVLQGHAAREKIGDPRAILNAEERIATTPPKTPPANAATTLNTNLSLSNLTNPGTNSSIKATGTVTVPKPPSTNK